LAAALLTARLTDVEAILNIALVAAAPSTAVLTH
jgi:hypothetical protein